MLVSKRQHRSFRREEEMSTIEVMVLVDLVLVLSKDRKRSHLYKQQRVLESTVQRFVQSLAGQ
jgi:hypothetical protein